MKGSLVKISTKPLHINTPDWWKCAATFHMQSFKPSDKKLEGHSERIYSNHYILFVFISKTIGFNYVKTRFCLAGASSCQLCIYYVLLNWKYCTYLNKRQHFALT